jgi:hypothetical protein
MQRHASLLDGLDVAEPCKASWDEMKGDERRRHCALCKLDVHDLSAYTRAEAEALVRSASGRFCARFRRRADGTVVTADCGPARRRIARRLLALRTAACALFAFLAGCGGRAERGEGGIATSPPAASPATTPETTPPELEVMGDVCTTEMLGRIIAPVPHVEASPKPASD